VKKGLDRKRLVDSHVATGALFVLKLCILAIPAAAQARLNFNGEVAVCCKAVNECRIFSKCVSEPQVVTLNVGFMA